MENLEYKMVKIKIFDEEEREPEKEVFLKLHQTNSRTIVLNVVDKHGNKIGDELLWFNTNQGVFSRQVQNGTDLTDLEKCGFKFDEDGMLEED